jgi:hypothetical protein
MSQHKHHYVPHFYLKHFASIPKCINILNLRDFNSYRNGSLKNQCYRNHLYGLDDSLEKVFANLEGVAALTISFVIQISRLPGRSTQDHVQLLKFLALQMMRTPVAINKVTQSVEKTRANLISSYGGMSPGLDEQLTLRPYEAAKIALGHFGEIYQCFSGLNCHLLVNRTAHSFITSDNPSFKYNLYCETIRGTGTLGASQSGFMMFTPLSPQHLVILYDKETYRCAPIHQNLTLVDRVEDIYQLNNMQVVNADCNLLFSNWSECDDFTAMARKCARLRKQKQIIVRELIPADGKAGDGILQYHEQTAILGLKLSFLSIRREAKRTPIGNRLAKFREPFDIAKLRPSPDDPRWRTWGLGSNGT